MPCVSPFRVKTGADVEPDGAAQTPEANLLGIVFFAGVENPGEDFIPQLIKHGRVSKKLADMNSDGFLK